MANGTSSNGFLTYLVVVEDQLIRSLVIILVLGLFGNITSFAVFRHKKLRSNPVAIFFSAASVVSIFILIFGISISLYSANYVSPSTYSILMCKLQLYIRHSMSMTVRTYIVLACVSCFFLSSSQVALQTFGSPLHAKWAAAVVPFIWPIIAFHIPIWTIIRNNKCIHDDSYVLPFAIYFLTVVGILPVVLMSMFILLTMKNLRKIHNRIEPTVAAPRRLKSRDQQFLRMLSSVVLMYVLTNIYFPLNAFYLAITNWVVKSPERVGIESIVYDVTSDYVLYINYVSPFFLFFFSSTAFRQSFYRICVEYWRYLTCKGRQETQISTSTVSTQWRKSTRTARVDA